MQVDKPNASGDTAQQRDEVVRAPGKRMNRADRRRFKSGRHIKPRNIASAKVVRR